jgi:hypothetical protein
VVTCESLDISPAGVDAVTGLGAGDMRRTLNILQSSFLAKGTCFPFTTSRLPVCLYAYQKGRLLRLPITLAVYVIHITRD